MSHIITIILIIENFKVITSLHSGIGNPLFNINITKILKDQHFNFFILSNNCIQIFKLIFVAKNLIQFWILMFYLITTNNCVNKILGIYYLSFYLAVN